MFVKIVKTNCYQMIFCGEKKKKKDLSVYLSPPNPLLLEDRKVSVMKLACANTYEIHLSSQLIRNSDLVTKWHM